MTRQYWRAGGMAVFAALAAAGVAGCGGSSSPHVASLGNSDAKSSVSTTTLPKGNPTQLLDEWATCDAGQRGARPGRSHHHLERGHPHRNAGRRQLQRGAVDRRPRQRRPVQQLSAGRLAGVAAGGQPLQKPDPAKLLKFSECMQKSGFPQFPDPSAGGGLSLQIQPGSTMNPNNPAFVNASKTCSKKTGRARVRQPG